MCVSSSLRNSVINTYKRNNCLICSRWHCKKETRQVGDKDGIFGSGKNYQRSTTITVYCSIRITQLKVTPPLQKKKHLRNTVSKMFEFVELVGMIKKKTGKE